MNKMLSTFMIGGVLALSAACASSGDSRRAGTPDEFRVVKKAPLTVPPEYSLRPPELGAVRPLEVSPQRADQVVSFGNGIGNDASDVEKMLVARAGAIAVSPVIRDIIDYDESGEDNATGGKPVAIERGSGRRIKLPGT